MKKILLISGIGIALFVLSQSSVLAQEKAEYVCTPCGCAGDTQIVHKPGQCGTCGMSLINLANPSAGLKYTNIWASQLCSILTENEDIVLLDVRSIQEHKNSARLKPFKNSINIPIDEVRDRLDELEKYKNKEIVVFCSISARSTRISQLLAANGFDHVHNLMGGLNFWYNQPLDKLPCRDTHLKKN